MFLKLFAKKYNELLSKLSKHRNILFYNSLHCGAKRVRTADLLTASQALSQLSYSPE